MDLNATAEWLARLIQTPGWGAWAKHYTKSLEEHDQSGQFVGLTNEVRQRIASSSAQRKNGASND